MRCRGELIFEYEKDTLLRFAAMPSAYFVATEMLYR